MKAIPDSLLMTYLPYKLSSNDTLKSLVHFSIYTDTYPNESFEISELSSIEIYNLRMKDKIWGTSDVGKYILLEPDKYIIHSRVIGGEFERVDTLLFEQNKIQFVKYLYFKSGKNIIQVNSDSMKISDAVRFDWNDQIKKVKRDSIIIYNVNENNKTAPNIK